MTTTTETADTALCADNDRQQYQLDFLASGQPLELGSLNDCPFSLDQLRQTQADSPWVRQSFDGLTAHVYQLEAGGRYWTLKRQRQPILVKNVDGQTSFLNELQRRRDIRQLKQQQPGSLTQIVDTCYGSLHEGLLLSPWIEGQHPPCFTQPLLSSLFSTLVELELAGLFEWDLSAGNLLSTGTEIRLFDFGYMYRFNPLCEYNSNGTSTPIFHGIERFETRYLFGQLLKLSTDAEALTCFAQVKEQALLAYEAKYRALERRRALPHVLEHLNGLLKRWQQGLSSASALDALYRLEHHRSLVLDLMDDLHGQSCTPTTLLKAERILVNLTEHYPLLREQGGLFFGDEALSQTELLSKYRRQLQLAHQYQL